MRANDITILFFFILWGSLFAFTVYYRTTRQRKCMVEVVATVTQINEERYRSRRGGGKTYQPTFTYEWKGFTRTLTPQMRSSYWKFEIGDQVTLLIDPEDGGNYRFKDFKYDPVSQMMAGFFFVTLTILIGWMTRK